MGVDRRLINVKCREPTKPCLLKSKIKATTATKERSESWCLRHTNYP